jgi:hypothetical protein
MALFAVLAATAGCGAGADYDAVRAAAAQWTLYINQDDAAVCDLMTDGLRRLVTDSDESAAAREACATAATAGLLLADVPPAVDAGDVEVPVWDPSGEAYAEVSRPGGGRFRLSMSHEDGQWLVARLDRKIPSSDWITVGPASSH